MPDCLLLNQSELPIETISWEDAVFKLLKNKVEVVETYEDRVIRTVTLEIKMPLVVRLVRGINEKQKSVKFSRQNVYDRDLGRCQYCGRLCSRKKATYDHVTPRSMGGATNWSNIVIACFKCNQKKGGRTPEQAGMRLRTVPMKPKKLPATVQLLLGWRPGMPGAWRQWMRDASYWHGALDES